MTKKETIATIPDDIISSKIYLIRGKKVMLDHDLDELIQQHESPKPPRKAIGFKRYDNDD